MAPTRFIQLLGVSSLLAAGVACSPLAPVDDDSSSGGRGPGEAGSGGSGSDVGNGDGVGGFVTELPGATLAQPAGSSGGAIAFFPDPPPQSELEAVLADSDLTRIDGNRLFAFSRNAGVSVLDITDPAALQVLGTHRSAGLPIEIHVEGSTLFELSNDPFQQDGDAAPVLMTSRLEVLDMSNPDAISTLHEFSLSGVIIEQRRLDDFLYVVTSENACPGCGDVVVHVTSFDVSAPAQVTLTDEVTLEARAPAPIDATTPRVTIADERIYVTLQGTTQTTHVVTINPETGALANSNQFELAGELPRNVHVDEFSEMARAFTQVDVNTGNPSTVLDTFATQGEPNAAPHSRLTLVLPRPQHLKTAAFDGTRAFAITSDEDTGSTLTIVDLSDSSVPKQEGSVELPGALAHVEVHGDRLLAWGGAPLAQLELVWVDVSNLAAPALASHLTLERSNQLHFGSPEKVAWLEEGALLAVPVSGFGAPDCQKGFESGLELVRVANDQLQLIASTRGKGAARRAFVHDETLFAVSDKEVRTFDIADETAPTVLSHADVARSVSHVVPAGDKVLRLGTEWWSDEATLDMTDATAASEPTTLSELDLRALPAPDSATCEPTDWYGEPIVRGRYAYVSRFVSLEGDAFGSRIHPTLFVVDLADPSELKVVFSLDLEAGEPGVRFLEPIATNNALLIGRARGQYNFDPWTDERAEAELAYDVIDLTVPEEPRIASRIDLPTEVARGGFGYTIPGTSPDATRGRSTLNAGTFERVYLAGNVVFSQHEESAGRGRVRYYLDRLDVSTPAAPQLLSAINIPGPLTSVAADGVHFTTLDYDVEMEAASSVDECDFGGFVRFENGQCQSYRRRAHSLVLSDDRATLLDSRTLDVEFLPDYVSVVGGTVYAYRAGELETLALDPDRRFEQLPSISAPSFVTPVDGTALVLHRSTAQEVDTSSATPSLIEHALWSWCSSPNVADGVLYCAMEGLGAQRVELGAP